MSQTEDPVEVSGPSRVPYEITEELFEEDVFSFPLPKWGYSPQTRNLPYPPVEGVEGSDNNLITLCT